VADATDRLAGERGAAMEDYGFLIFCAVWIIGAWALSRLVAHSQRNYKPDTSNYTGVDGA
jgi:hypothetical protein